MAEAVELAVRFDQNAELNRLVSADEILVGGESRIDGYLAFGLGDLLMPLFHHLVDVDGLVCYLELHAEVHEGVEDYRVRIEQSLRVAELASDFEEEVLALPRSDAVLRHLALVEQLERLDEAAEGD